MNKSESRYFNTALLMDEALVSLLEYKDFEYITVKEICEKAGVNRSTFYLHYETIADLLSECLKYYDERFMNSFAAAPDDFLSDIGNAPLNGLILVKTEFLKPYLSFIREHKSLYKATYQNPSCMQAGRRYQYMSEQILRPIMSRFNISEKEQPYWISFFVHGTAAIIQQWIQGGCMESVEEIETIILHCIRPQSGFKDAFGGE